MWEAVQLPRETDAPEETERLIQQFAEEKMQEYDGNIFFCISRRDHAAFRRDRYPGTLPDTTALRGLQTGRPFRGVLPASGR